MGPPPDNRRQVFRWSCFGTGPDALVTATETFVLPPFPGDAAAAVAAAGDPRAVAGAWLAAAGFASPDEARARVALPRGRRVVAGWDPVESESCPAVVAEGVVAGLPSPRAAVRIALVLSLCSTWVYDPDGPLLWTALRLRRQVRLGRTDPFHEPG